MIHSREGMASILAAGGLLEGLARGTAALAPTSPAVQALGNLLVQACAQCPLQPAAAGIQDQQHPATIDVSTTSNIQPLGVQEQQAAAAIACCQTWQVPCCKCLPQPAGKPGLLL